MTSDQSAVQPTTPAASSSTPAPKPPSEPWLSPQVSSYFIAGGIAGAASRTVVSPLERLKIIQQVQPRNSGKQYTGVWRSLVRMWREEGFKGFMRGNGINCVRIIPYSAVQFTAYEQLKKWFTSNGKKQLDTPTRLASGALAGVTSVCTTYPLDLVRSRLSIATASMMAANSSATSSSSSSSSLPPSSMPPSSSAGASASSQLRLASALHTSARPLPSELTMWGMTLKVMRDEGGFRALYRGLVATAMGVAPYVGINFAAYEALRSFITPPGKNGVARKLSCGALAGSVSQTLTYPFDVLRRKMQVIGLGQGALGYQYNGALDAARVIFKTEGIRGMYRGLWPNLLKVAPSISTSFFTYEMVKEFLLGGTGS